MATFTYTATILNTETQKYYQFETLANDINEAIESIRSHFVAEIQFVLITRK